MDRIKGVAVSVSVVMVWLFVGSPHVLAQIVAWSTYNVDDEGWRLSGDASSAVPTHVASGGSPGGYIRGFDQGVGGVWYWDAPIQFLGNTSGAYGYSLSYDLRMRGTGATFADSDLILDGAGLSLHLANTLPAPQDISWTSYSAVLSEVAGWRVGSLTGPIVSQAQMQAVLTDLDRLRIRGEFIDGPDNGDIDNVILGLVSVPEPSSLLILAAVVALGGAKHRNGMASRLK